MSTKVKSYIFILASFTLFAACAIMSTVSSIGRTSVDLNGYVSIEISGYSGTATAETALDESTLRGGLFNVSVSKRQAEKAGDYEWAAFIDTEDAEGSLVQIIEYGLVLDKTEEISNGDTITLTLSFSEEELKAIKKIFGVGLIFNEETLEVSGLPLREVEESDIERNLDELKDEAKEILLNASSADSESFSFIEWAISGDSLYLVYKETAVTDDETLSCYTWVCFEGACIDEDEVFSYETVSIPSSYVVGDVGFCYGYETISELESAAGISLEAEDEEEEALSEEEYEGYSELWEAFGLDEEDAESLLEEIFGS